MTTCRGATAVKSNVLAIMLIFLFPLVLQAANAEPPKMDMDLTDVTIRNGEKLFTSLCQNCHSLKYLGYEARMAAEDARRAFGTAPPDLSLMAKARGGTGYIYSLLVSFNDTEQKNSVFPNIAMPPPLAKADPEFTQKAKDVSAFLEYAAEPSERERRGLGRYVVGYMFVLTLLLYALNSRNWKGIRNNPS